MSHFLVVKAGGRAKHFAYESLKNVFGFIVAHQNYEYVITISRKLWVRNYKLSQQQVDTRAPGVRDLGAEKVNEVHDMIYHHQTEVRCKKCGSQGAIIHLEEWSDGLTYSDYGCSACGFSEVY